MYATNEELIPYTFVFLDDTLKIQMNEPVERFVRKSASGEINFDQIFELGDDLLESQGVEYYSNIFNQVDGMYITHTFFIIGKGQHALAVFPSRPVAPGVVERGTPGLPQTNAT